jgi:hypothetical protein
MDAKLQRVEEDFLHRSRGERHRKCPSTPLVHFIPKNQNRRQSRRAHPCIEDEENDENDREGSPFRGLKWRIWMVWYSICVWIGWIWPILGSVAFEDIWHAENAEDAVTRRWTGANGSRWNWFWQFWQVRFYWWGK